jgi:hypothetical protein
MLTARDDGLLAPPIPRRERVSASRRWLLRTTPRRCLTVAGDSLALVAGCVTWKLEHDTQFIPQPLPSTVSATMLTSLSCSSQGHCVAAGYNFGLQDPNDPVNDVIANDGPGGQWDPAPPIAGATDSVIASTCSPLACIAVTSQGTVWPFESFDSIGLWGPQGNEFRLPPKSGYGPAGGMSCDPSGTFCLVLAGYLTDGDGGGFDAPSARVYVTTFGPRTDFEQLELVGRTPRATLDGSILLPSCGAAGTCMAITDPAAYGVEGRPDHGEVWITRDAGRTWQAMRVLTGAPTAISCATASTCAVGSDLGYVSFTADGGRRWRTDSIPGWSQPICTSSAENCADPEPVSGVSCWSATSCVTSTDGLGYSQNGAPFPSGGVMETSDAGRTWTPISVPAVLIDGISCAGPHDCWAYGQSNEIRATAPEMIHWG